jgi:hypothetical protein
MGARARHEGRFRRYGLAVVVAGAAVMAVVVARPSQSPATAACGASWQVDPSPPTGHGASGGSTLSGLDVIGPADVWAVGDQLSATTNNHVPLTEHWNGSAWSVVPSPSGSTRANGLQAVSGAVGSDVWAVGYTLTDAGYRTLIERWNGSAWRLVSSPSPGTTDNGLVAAAAPDRTHVWAAGYRTSSPGSTRILVERWNGTSWRVVSTPDPGSTEDAILDLSARSAQNVWAVGYQKSAAGYRSLVEHWDGTAWSVVAAPNPGSTDTVLTGVHASASGVWAVGYANSGGVDRPIALRRVGGTWAVTVPATTGSADAVLRDVTATSTGTVWAVGARFDTGSMFWRTLVERWQNGAWSVVPSPNPTTWNDELLEIDGRSDASRLWAVGSASAATIFASCPGMPAASGQAVPAVAPVAARSADQREPASAPSAARPTQIGGGIVATDVAPRLGVAETTRDWSAAVADFNRDGWPDFFLARHPLPGRVEINQAGAGFVEVDPNRFGARDRHGCAAADFSGDGRPDIFCDVGADRGTGIKANTMHIQQADGTFRDLAPQMGLLDPFGRGRRMTAIDANGDGRPDLFVGNSTRPDGMPSPDRLYLNQGGSTFRDAPASGIDRGLGAYCAHAFDENGDGRQDLILCTKTADLGPSQLSLRVFENVGGTHFTDVTNALGLSGIPARDAAMADFNGDGRPDIAWLSGNWLAVRLRGATAFQPPVFSRSVSDAQALAVGDVNGDRRPDIYVVQGRNASGNAPDLLLVNNGAGTGFTSEPIPETTSGVGDAAYPIDYDRNGLTDFLVLNGYEDTAGPLQLVAFTRSP